MFRNIRRECEAFYFSSRRAIARMRISDFIPFFLKPGFYWDVITLPVIWLLAAWPQRRFKNLLFGLPSLIVFGFALFQVHRIREEQPGLVTLYWEGAQSAVRDRNHPLAEMLLSRVLTIDRSHADDARYLLASVYEETGNEDRAEVMFRALAPDGRRGYRPAHKRIAALYAQSISAESSREELELLKWHLDVSSDEETPVMALAWGRYALALQDLEGARKYMLLAVAEFPELWVTIGEIDLRLNDNDRALASYEKARQFLSQQLSEKQTDRKSRVDYASVLMRLGKLDEAKNVLEEGLRIDPEGQWNSFLATLYVNYCDLLSMEGKGTMSDLLVPLGLALEHDPNHVPALQRLMSFATATVEGNEEIKTLLARVVAEAKEPALAHLAMGNVYSMENDGDSARFHFELALSNNSKLAVVMNNLGWLMAHDPNKPDLKRALELSNAALAESPDNEEFLDTRGTIYLKLGDYRNSLTDLEKSLSLTTRIASQGASSPALQTKLADLHQRIATVYEHLNRPEMVESHRGLEQAIRQSLENGLR